jgi:tripartite-type tricarboxylate transporter receptor subunit TctC
VGLGSSVARVRLRRAAAAGMALIAWACLPAVAAEPAYPSRPVKLVVPYPPGGAADVLARLVAERLPAALGQPVVVENRAGGGAAIAARYVAAAPADGYTLLLGTNTSHAINPALQPATIGYHPVRDFTAIAALGDIPLALVVHPGRRIGSLAELAVRAKAHPGTLTYASGGIGTSNHLAGQLLAGATNARFTHVPYKGNAPALNDVMAGQVDFMFDLATTAHQPVEAGRLVALAVTGRQRSPLLPGVPTVAEAGYPEVAMTSWFGVFAPAHLPSQVTETLIKAFGQMLDAEDTAGRLRALGVDRLDERGSAFSRWVAEDFQRWTAVAAKLRIDLD